ncbi:Protein NRT1/ PTR FAMILY 2.6 [Bienertia sinuspersici]
MNTSESELQPHDVSNNEVQIENARNGRQHFSDSNKGGWVTFPFIIVALMGLSFAATGWMANLVVYAIEEYNIKEITAAKLHNIAIGGMTFAPVIGAVLADSLFGSFAVFIGASFISLLGAIMLTLSATIPSLRPPPCSTSSLAKCKLPSIHQQGFLYSAVALAVVGAGGTGFVLGTIGASQFPTSSEHERIFFNWFIAAQQLSELIGYTVIVYVQSNVSWGVGFGICVVANTIAIIVFFCGLCFFRRMKRPQGGSPFTSLARVLVASIRKMNTHVRAKDGNDNRYFSGNSTLINGHTAPSNSLSFFNRAALVIEDNDHNDADQIQKFTKSWSLCTVNEVEDLKKLVKVLRILSAGIIPSIIFGLGFSLVAVQALVMDRNMGSHQFQIPAGSMFVFILLSTCLGISILDRVIHPLMLKFVNRSPTPLECIGVGYFLVILASIAYALVEKERLHLVKTHHLMEQAHAVAPMSVFWLVLPLGIMGFGSSCYFSTLMRFYYQELPMSLKNTATALIGLQFSLGTYLGTIVLSVVQHTTSWLPHDINHGHLDYLYWMLTILGILSFVYYLLCSRFYEYSDEINTESLEQGHL